MFPSFCSVYSQLPIFFADNLQVLLWLRFLHGIWFSILTTVTVPIANEFIPDSRRGEGMGYFVMSVNLGIVLGPLIGLSLIQPLSYAVVATILAAIVCLGFVFCFLIPVQTETSTMQKMQKKQLSIHDFVEKKALPVSIMAMMVSFAYASIMSFISTYSASKNLLAYASLFFIVFAISIWNGIWFCTTLFTNTGDPTRCASTDWARNLYLLYFL